VIGNLTKSVFRPGQRLNAHLFKSCKHRLTGLTCLHFIKIFKGIDKKGKVKDIRFRYNRRDVDRRFIGTVDHTFRHHLGGHKLGAFEQRAAEIGFDINPVLCLFPDQFGKFCRTQAPVIGRSDIYLKFIFLLKSSGLSPRNHQNQKGNGCKPRDCTAEYLLFFLCHMKFLPVIENKGLPFSFHRIEQAFSYCFAIILSAYVSCTGTLCKGFQPHRGMGAPESAFLLSTEFVQSQ